MAAALGTWVSNPLNMLPLYMLFYYTGCAVSPFEVPPFDTSQLEVAQMLDMGWRFIVAMLAGGLVYAIPGSILAYVITRKAVSSYRQRKGKTVAAAPDPTKL